MIQTAIRINSNKVINSMPKIESNCSDNGDLFIDPKYAKNSTPGDFVLFLGIKSKFKNSYKRAHASHCYQGNLKNFFNQ